MSAELETLDQLLGGALSLAVIRNLYPDGEAFRRGVFGLLSSGDVCLLMIDQTIVPSWRWREGLGLIVRLDDSCLSGCFSKPQAFEVSIQAWHNIWCFAETSG